MFTKLQYADLVYSITETIDLISPIIADHHKLVAYISLALGKELKLSAFEQMELEIAGSLHDIGGLTLHERLAPIEFEYIDTNLHAEKSYLLLKNFKPLENVARIIRYHHKSWQSGNCEGIDGQLVPFESHVINLADRIAVIVDHSNENILNSVDAIVAKLLNYSGPMFNPTVMNAFLTVAKRDNFWLEMRFLEKPTYLSLTQRGMITTNQFDEFITLVSHIIDFKSHFTAAHSSTIAACAEIIAKHVGFSEGELKMIKYAGYIHDLGKLSIPTEVLEKPAPLSKEEFAMMRSHTFHTNRVLSKINGFDTIRIWGSLHHEKLNGKGYPFSLKDEEIPLGARVMAVADIFTALRETRPYRGPMSKVETLEVMLSMADAYEIDRKIVELLRDNYDEIDEIRHQAHENAIAEYDKFNKEFEQIKARLNTSSL